MCAYIYTHIMYIEASSHRGAIFRFLSMLTLFMISNTPCSKGPGVSQSMPKEK